MDMDRGIRNITVKITVEVFTIALSNLYQISCFIMHVHKCTMSVCTKTPPYLSKVR